VDYGQDDDDPSEQDRVGPTSRITENSILVVYTENQRLISNNVVTIGRQYTIRLYFQIQDHLNGLLMAKYSSRERTRYHVREAKKRNVLNTPNASQSPAVELNPPLKQSQSHGVFTFGITDERILTKAAITSSEVLRDRANGAKDKHNYKRPTMNVRFT
jgi:hypothetical protein